ncbi:MAG: hypothetical protein JNM07_11400 [Phycisphaerae bacterium]|nr:hypothetical protein [Phycisphaerae bacterium]
MNSSGRPGRSNAEPEGRRASFIVWHNRGAPAPVRLLECIAKRGDPCSVHTGAAGVVAEACVAARRARDGGWARPGAHNGIVMIAAEPESLPELARVTAALTVYAPGVAIWYFRAGANPELSRGRMEVGTSDAGPRVVVTQKGIATVGGQTESGPERRWTPPPLRLTSEEDWGPGTGEGTSQGTPAHAGETGGVELSAEELAMLLGEEDEPRGRADER